MIIITRITDKINICTHYCGTPTRYNDIGVDCSILSNGFNLKFEKDRDEAYKNYKKYFDKQLTYKSNTKFKQSLNVLLKAYKKAIKEKSYIALGCFCYPSKCHCDIIKDWLVENK